MKTLTASLALCAVLIPSGANAALESRLGGLALYDTDLNITWSTNTFRGDWDSANAWAAGLTIGGISGWRLPTSDGCRGFNCTGSELGHLFYNELGGVAGQPITMTHNANYNLLALNGEVWSGLLYGGVVAEYFIFNTGMQTSYYKYSGMAAVAVHSGDVAPVPVPAAAWLLGSGLLCLIGVARRKAA